MAGFQCLGLVAFGFVAALAEDFVVVDNYKAVPQGAISASASATACQMSCKLPACSQWFFNKKSKKCHISHDAKWGGKTSDHGISGCLPSLVDGCPKPPSPSPPAPPAPTPPAPTPTPPTPPAPSPTPPGPLPKIDHQQLASPTRFAAGSSPQGAAMRGVFYFLPPPGATAFITYDSSKKSWGTLEIDASSGVTRMLKGASLAAVPATVPGLDDFLVVSGGGTKNVLALNMRTKTWKAMAAMRNSQVNSCSVGCLGYWMSMTGDMKKEDGDLQAGKPTNRQEYRYNLTSGEHFEVNGEKSRGGAGCACDEAANSGHGRSFWAGGYSNSGETTQVEMWSVNPNKRGGQPIFKMSAAKRDVGAAACGGHLIVAGGKDANVDVFNSSSVTDGARKTYKMDKAHPSPRITCVGKRVALISGGNQNKVFVVDTAALPAAGSALPSLPLPLSGAGQVAVAADASSGMAMYFDGQHADLFSLSGLSASILV